MTSDTLPGGAPYAIGQAIVEALRSNAALTGAVVLDNPQRASALQDGDRIVFFEDQADRLNEQPGQSAKRTYSFTLGVISRSSEARKDAHADYRTAKRTVRNCMPAISQVVSLLGRGIQEGDVAYRIENIDVGGALVLGSFSVDYRDPG